MNEIQRANNYLDSMPDLNYNVKQENLALLLRAFEGLENHILGLGPQSAYGGEFMMEIFKQGAGITHANHLLFIEELRKVNDMIMDLRGTGATRGSPRLEHFVTCLKRVFGHKLEARCLAKASSYRVVSPCCVAKSSLLCLIGTILTSSRAASTYLKRLLKIKRMWVEQFLTGALRPLSQWKNLPT